MTPAGPAAVVDIGSNSIKLLVAARAPGGGLDVLHEHTEETRIGTGITGRPPRLQDDAAARAVAAVARLLAAAGAFAPGGVRIVATSAVRDAANREAFVTALRAATGHDLQILSGIDEARLIGRGIACDPALAGAADFDLFDLGGGSLEVVCIRARNVARLASLPLGCVRVTEACVPRPDLPLAAADIARVQAQVRTVAHEAGFPFHRPAPAIAVLTGGTATTFRAIAAAQHGTDLVSSSPVLAVERLAGLAAELSAQDLAARRACAGLPAARADVFPAALWTLVEIAKRAGIREFRHSFYNLRFGVADELLAAPTP